MYKSILIVAVIFFVSVDAADAQRRGRFLQKVKRELFGDKQEEQERKPEAKKETQRPLPSSRSPQRYNQLSFGQQRQPNRPSLTNQLGATGSGVRRPPENKSIHPIQPRNQTRSRNSASQSTGFGFRVAEGPAGRLVVSSVDRAGNAAEAGLRRGDVIAQIGGIEASSVDEYDEITRIMSAGDQMEFQIERGGRKKTIEIGFGQLEAVPPQSSGRTSSSSPRFDFAPPTAGQPSSAFRPAKAVVERLSDQREIDPTARLNQTIQRQRQQIRALQNQIRILQSQRRRLP